MSNRAARRTRKALLQTQRPVSGAQASVALLVVLTVMVYSLGPPALPYFFQRVFATVHSSLAMVAVMCVVREYAGAFNRFRIPGLGRIGTGKLLGALTFVAVFLWWLSPWAPIGVTP